MDHHTQNYLKVMRDLQEYFSKLDNQHPGPYPTFSNLIISYIFFSWKSYSYTCIGLKPSLMASIKTNKQTNKPPNLPTTAFALPS